MWRLLCVTSNVREAVLKQKLWNPWFTFCVFFFFKIIHLVTSTTGEVPFIQTNTLAAFLPTL